MNPLKGRLFWLDLLSTNKAVETEYKVLPKEERSTNERYLYLHNREDHSFLTLQTKDFNPYMLKREAPEVSLHEKKLKMNTTCVKYLYIVKVICVL